VLLIKLSSLGDVVHTLPAAMDVSSQFPQATLDWVVEPAFAPLLRLCPALDGVIEMDLRRWRRRPWSSESRSAWRRFKQNLQAHEYDWVIDLQGLSKSALVSYLARTTEKGVRVAMAHRTDGSSYEAPTRWVADRCVSVPTHIHAVERARWVCAQALGYSVPKRFQPGLSRSPDDASTLRQVLCVHGTTREDKLWPDPHWIELGHRLLAEGWTPVFAHGNLTEQSRAERLCSALPGSQVWPKASLDELTTKMARLGGVIGVDSGLSHIAVALGLPHVQIYNFDTAWRTGPQYLAHQISLVASPSPSVDAVWQAWHQVMGAVA
jgi:heptosyltransferase-1